MNCQYKGVELTKEEQLRYEIERLRGLLREAAKWLGDNDDEDVLVRRIERELGVTPDQPQACSDCAGIGEHASWCLSVAADKSRVAP